MTDIEAAEDHVLFRTKWDGRDRVIFVNYGILERLAGKRMNRAASVRYVDRNRAEIIALGIRGLIAGPDDTKRTITIDEMPS